MAWDINNHPWTITASMDRDWRHMKVRVSKITAIVSDSLIRANNKNIKVSGFLSQRTSNAVNVSILWLQLITQAFTAYVQLW